MQQLSIFDEDNTTALLNAAVDEALTGQGALTGQALVRLQRSSPLCPGIAHVQALIHYKAMVAARTPKPNDHAAIEREANLLLGPVSQALRHTRDDWAQQISSHWMRLAQYAHALAFHPEHPRAFQGWLYAQAGSWQEAAKLLVAITHWTDSGAIAHARLNAQWHVGAAPAAWPDFCVLAWNRPDLARVWAQHQTSEPFSWLSAFDDLDPGLDMTWFPAWCCAQSRHLTAFASPVTPPKAEEPWINALWAIRDLYDRDTPQARARLQCVRSELLLAFLQRRATAFVGAK